MKWKDDWKDDLKEIPGLLKTTFEKWNKHRAPEMAAALSFYTLFSMTPLFIVAIAVAGFVFGPEAAKNEIVGQIQGLVGKDGAEMVQGMIENANKPGVGILATIVGIVTLLLGAAGVFGQLKASLNRIWEVPDRASTGFLSDILFTIRQQFISFTMVLGTGFMLLVSLILSAVLSALGKFLSDRVALTASIWELVNFAVSLVIITALFAALYKVLPEVKIGWRDVWVGGLITAILFTLGKYLLGLYLGQSTVGSAYGAAGALVIILVWVNYSAQLFFLGAEFTHTFATSHHVTLPLKPTEAEPNPGSLVLADSTIEPASPTLAELHAQRARARLRAQQRAAARKAGRSVLATIAGVVAVPYFAVRKGVHVSASWVARQLRRLPGFRSTAPAQPTPQNPGKSASQ